MLGSSIALFYRCSLVINQLVLFGWWYQQSIAVRKLFLIRDVKISVLDTISLMLYDIIQYILKILNLIFQLADITYVRRKHKTF